jgi:hypothetical protein
MPDILKNDIAVWLAKMHGQCDKPSRMNNRDTLLCDVYIWQEAMILAKRHYDDAIKDLATLVPSDENLRRLGVGEHTIEPGNAFAFLAKISKPRETFDKDAFIATVARKFRVPVAKLEAVAEVSKKEGNAALSKRVIEL